jgi:hypothetical protein
MKMILRIAILGLTAGAILLGCSKPTASLGTVEKPVLSPAGGTYGDALLVTMESTTPGAGVRYTLDGSLPSGEYGRLYEGVPVQVTSSVTVKAVAFREGWDDSAAAAVTYTLNGTVTAPTFSLAGGSYPTTQYVTMSTPTAGASLRYTLDGSTPTATYGTEYTGTAIGIARTATLKALAYKTGLTSSVVVEATYTIMGTVANPTYTPPGGTYPEAQVVTMGTSTEGATIRYTTDGSYPTPSYGTIYDGSQIDIPRTMTLRAIAYKTDMLNSAVASATYTISAGVATPTLNPPAGTYTTQRTVTIATTTVGATIHYTLDGTTPSQTNGTPYTAPVVIPVTTTLKAMAFKTGWNDSNVVTGAYTIAVDATGNVGSYTNVAWDGASAWIAYYDTTNQDVKLAKSSDGGASWTIQRVDGTGGVNVGQYLSLAVAGIGPTIAISYYESGGQDLRCAVSTNGGVTWTRSLVDATNNTGQYTSTAIDGLGNVVISYYDATAFDVKLATAASPYDTWTLTTVESVNIVGQYSQLALNSVTGQVYVAYYDASNANLRLAYAASAAGPWSFADIDTVGTVGEYPSLRFDGVNTLWASWFDRTNGNLKVGSATAGAENLWTVYAAVDTSGTVGMWTSLSVSGANIAISYYEEYNYNLKVARSTTGGAGPWTKQTVDTAGVGWYTSIRDTGTELYVSYYDFVNADLKMAKYNGSTWTLY